MHEIFRICDKYSLDFYLFVPAFSSLLNSDLLEVQTSLLKHLALSVNLINKHFKYQVLIDLWDMEKFSLKEAQNEPDVDKYTV